MPPRALRFGNASLRPGSLEANLALAEARLGIVREKREELRKEELELLREVGKLRGALEIAR